MDSHELADLLRRNAGLIHRVALAYCRDASDREDVVQEVAVRLWQARDRFDGRARESTWVYRIAFNVAMSFHRRERRHRHKRADLAVEALAVPAPPRPDERMQAMLDALGELDPLDRALVLLWLDDNEHAEIAAVLGISVTNVGTRLHRIRQRLRDLVARKTEQEARDARR